MAAGALAGATGTCPLGDAWLAERTAEALPPARVDGREVDFADAVEASAAILRRGPAAAGVRPRGDRL